MDQTSRPVKIPPDFSVYAESKNIFNLFKDIMQELIIWKPTDALKYIVEYLQRTDKQRYRVLIIGPPCSGKRVHAKQLSKDLDTVHISRDNLTKKAQNNLKEIVNKCWKESKPIPPADLIDILKIWFNEETTINKGWVIDGLIETKEQAVALANTGNFPTHCIVLEAKDQICLERCEGKLVNSKTGDVYHKIFDMPTDETIQKDLVSPDLYSPSVLNARLHHFNKHLQYIKDFYKNIITVVNVDLAKKDVYARILAIACQPKRTAAPRVPRLLLIGPTGSGKKTQANLLATKYKLNKIIVKDIIEKEIVNKTKIGLNCKEFIDLNEKIPDEIILDLIERSINNLNCDSCGWILIGYPNTADHASMLNARDLGPNRVFFLDINDEDVLERLTQRAFDPISGNRYHMKHRPPPTSIIHQRLIMNPEDQVKAVEARLAQYRSHEAGLKELYNNVVCNSTLSCQYVEANMDVYRVFESIESMMVEPLPTVLSK